MLKLSNIKKDYITSSSTVHALKGITLEFRKSEFVSILGQSGCGKTTLLNIIGGLDRYTSGDITINDKSTKQFDDRDWDAYRNHSIGFVFQTYNLIPHQTVLQNVELALTLSGVPKLERRHRAIKALEQVGLKDQLKKKPSEMSGGQMQRVAIARALVNDPDIILADEPTGALDTETSLQVMEILKSISSERLVIMVTHNPELADKYSSRIIRMLDGLVVSDTMPFHAPKIVTNTLSNTKSHRRTYIGRRILKPHPITTSKNKKCNRSDPNNKPSMSFGTSFKLSLKNLLSKKGRTALTSFAGSIGIIGIALILAVSQGMTSYISHVQESTLSSYPLTLTSTSIDLSQLMASFLDRSSKQDNTHELDAVYKEAIITDMINALSKVETSENDLKSFKAYLETHLANTESDLYNAVNGVQYTYNIELPIYTKNVDNTIIKSDTQELMTKMVAKYLSGNMSSGNLNSSSSNTTTPTSFLSMTMSTGMWQELLPDTNGDHINSIIKEQYDLIYGNWPNEYDEVILVLNKNNELDDLSLYALGLLGEEEIDTIIDAAINGTELPYDNRSWPYEEICSLTYRSILPSDCYVYDPITGVYKDLRTESSGINMLYNNALELKITGIIRPNESAEMPMLNGSICYTNMLTKYLIQEAKNSEVVLEQMESKGVDVLTGLPFKENAGSLTAEQKKDTFSTYLDSLSDDNKADLYVKIKSIIPATLLETQTSFILNQMQDRDALVSQMATYIASQIGVPADTIIEGMQDMTLDQLKEMIRPIIEDQIKEQYANEIETSMASMNTHQKVTALNNEIPSFTLDQWSLYYTELMEFSDSTYEDNLILFGCADIDSPDTINIYATSFEAKDVIVAAIDTYNSSIEEVKHIKFTDYMGLMMSSITQIIDAITYVLIAFVAISLIVSSIMIGVITLISVQERTKEIGILRAIGASKKNVSSMFTAETLIIGCLSGLLGVGVTYLLCIPINIILYTLTGIPNLNAILPIGAAVVLVIISMLLTLISGTIPSKSAAKKDPVIALRSE